MANDLLSLLKKPARLDPRPTDAMSRAQIALILGLETVLHHAGLILTCPRCAADGHATLTTGNSPKDDTWKIDCRCRRRRISSADRQPMASSGDLLLLVDDLLSPLNLAVRCPTRTCLLTPLEMRQTPEGLIVTCHCGCQRRFRQTTPLIRPH